MNEQVTTENRTFKIGIMHIFREMPAEITSKRKDCEDEIIKCNSNQVMISKLKKLTTG